MGKSKSVPAPERVTLGKFESEKVAMWLRQIGETSKGFLALSKSDLLNFLIREHKSEFSAKELNGLRVAHCDPIRHIDWITKALKSALATGDAAMVARLQEEIKGVELSVTMNAPGDSEENDAGLSTSPSGPSKRKRTKKSDLSDAVNLASQAETEGQLSEE